MGDIEADSWGLSQLATLPAWLWPMAIVRAGEEGMPAGSFDHKTNNITVLRAANVLCRLSLMHQDWPVDQLLQQFQSLGLVRLNSHTLHPTTVECCLR
jgi:hypothetical protein